MMWGPRQDFIDNGLDERGKDTSDDAYIYKGPKLKERGVDLYKAVRVRFLIKLRALNIPVDYLFLPNFPWMLTQPL